MWFAFAVQVAGFSIRLALCRSNPRSLSKSRIPYVAAMVSVGVLAALINIAVLILVALADRAIELIVKRFAASRLRHCHRVPVVHDSDTWLPNIPRSIFKFHKHPGKHPSSSLPPLIISMSSTRVSTFKCINPKIFFLYPFLFCFSEFYSCHLFLSMC